MDSKQDPHLRHALAVELGAYWKEVRGALEEHFAQIDDLRERIRTLAFRQRRSGAKNGQMAFEDAVDETEIFRLKKELRVLEELTPNFEWSFQDALRGIRENFPELDPDLFAHVPRRARA